MDTLGIGEKKARKLTRACGGTDFMLAIPSKAARRGDHARFVHRTPKHFISSQSTRIFQYRLRPCELLHLDIIFLGSIALTSLFSLFYVTREDRQETEETALFKP